jgi:hypothetical protein
MQKNFKEMTYKEFKEWCNDRACDGAWGVYQAMTYIKIMEAIDSIHIKGLFKKRATKKEQELAWKDCFLETVQQ